MICKCKYCGEEMESGNGPRPENILLLHRKEGIMVIWFCGKQKCMDQAGFFLLGVATNKKIQEKIDNIIK